MPVLAFAVTLGYPIGRQKAAMTTQSWSGTLASNATTIQSPPPGAEALLELAEHALRNTALDVLEVEARELRAVYPHLSDRIDAVLSAARGRSEQDRSLRMNEARLAEAQRLGTMGSYDWEIATDTNVWSDELYRIYGTEPQSFNASYEKFMEFIHPDDRDKIKAVHAQAFATCLPYNTEERIVRPDGEVRVLLTTGEVATDAEGHPARIYGVCRDITEQRRAEALARRQSERFEALVESSPDAVLVVDGAGIIVQVNRQTQAAFGYSPDELVGHRIDILLPPELFDADQPMPADLELLVRHKNGSGIPVDVSRGVLTTDEGTMVAAFVRDVTERKRAQEYALKLHDAEVRRRHALEINDNVVQGLSAASYAFEAGFDEDGVAAVRNTVGAARLMMNDLLGDSARAALHAGDLVRERPAASALPIGAAIRATGTAETGAARRVLLVDDASDIRLLLRRVLHRAGGFEVVGEAANGREAITLAETLQPDLVVLDLAMPVMDGLEALPLIRGCVPKAKVVVLSGFDEARTANAALNAGADAYVEKGGELAIVVSVLESLLPVTR